MGIIEYQGKLYELRFTYRSILYLEKVFVKPHATILTEQRELLLTSIDESVYYEALMWSMLINNEEFRNMTLKTFLDDLRLYFSILGEDFANDPESSINPIEYLEDVERAYESSFSSEPVIEENSNGETHSSKLKEDEPDFVDWIHVLSLAGEVGISPLSIYDMTPLEYKAMFKGRRVRDTKEYRSNSIAFQGKKLPEPIKWLGFKVVDKEYESAKFTDAEEKQEYINKLKNSSFGLRRE